MDQQKIGTFLKQLRQERQLTQENLAEIMCVTNRSVSRWENGVNLPDLPTLIQLADFYGDFSGSPVLQAIQGACLGIGLGMLIVGAIFTSKYGNKIIAFKVQMLKHKS